MLQEEGITAQQQMWIGPYVRTDLLIGQVVVEVDGAVKYSEDAQQAALNQVARENWIRLQHYEVVRITPKMLMQDEAHCVQQIRELVALSARLGPPKVPATAARPTHGEDWRTRTG